MIPATGFSFTELPAWDPRHLYQRRLAHRSFVKPAILSGDEIAAALNCGDRFLVVTSHDYFEGTSHWFHLLTRDGRVLDAAATPNYLGFLRELAIDSPTSISFGFFGTNDRWTLSVADIGYSFRLKHLARRLNRFVASRRHMSFEYTRGPPWSLSWQAAEDPHEH